MKNIHKINENIYITNDEEIKEGDWVLMFDDLGNLFLCDKPQQYLGIEKGHHLNKGLRKIILTTDQDLIADGIQSIDDEFLEWFVKNPSCEWVKVGKTPKVHFIIKESYKIIIPKEENSIEAKQRAKNYMSLKGALDSQYVDFSNPNADKITSASTTTIKEEPKQETIEEAVEKYANELPKPYNYGINSDKKKGFIEGAKWQAKQNNTSKVNRVEVIQHSEPYNGRAYTNYNVNNVDIQIQDDGKTLKIFLK